MPKLGTSIRIISAVAAAALLAVVVAGAANAKPARQASTISGAGSTFVAPLVSQWISPVGSALGIELQYSSVGSGAGIASITARTVDFGASDAPLTSDQFNACNGCEQIPWALGGTSIMYNLPGVKNLLHMDGPTLAKIFMGQITKWDDPAIATLNKGVSLPEHGDHDRAPLGRLGNDVQPDRLPVGRQPGVGVGSSARHRGQLAGRRRR